MIKDVTPVECPVCHHAHSLHYAESNSKPNAHFCHERLSNDNNDFCCCEHGAPAVAPLVIYALRNQEGKWFRTKGAHGYGKSWVDDINDAKLYMKLGQVRGRRTFFATNYDEKFGVPDIIKLTVSSMEVLNDDAAFRKAKKAKESKTRARDESHRKYEIQLAEKRIADGKRAEQALASLRKR